MRLKIRHLITLFLAISSSTFAQNQGEGFEWIQGPEVKAKPFSFNRPFKGKAKDAYVTRKSEVTIEYRQPRPLKDPKSFEALNSEIFSALPGLDTAIENAELSPLFESFYLEKAKYFAGGGSIDQYNYFDCATILEGTLPDSGEDFLLLQTDMDVDTDGTDPLRFPNVEDYSQALISKTYQPQLSYSWWGGNSLPKNPLIDYYGKANQYLLERIDEFKNQAENAAAFHEKRAWSSIAEETEDLAKLYSGMAEKYQSVNDDKRRSLVGEKDPFIVIPRNWDKHNKSDKTGTIERGCLAAVIVDGTVYPAIVGDSGIEYKMGEASLLIAKTVNKNASGLSRAVTGPKATYIIFPKTGKHDQVRKMPDFDEVQREVRKRLDEIVPEGSVGRYFEW